MKKLFVLIVMSNLFIFSSKNNLNICHLSGEVVNRKSKVLLLKKKTNDARNQSVEIQIDSSGKFNYDLKYQFVEAYELIFKDEFEKGSWQSITFFPDATTVTFKLYSEKEATKNSIQGSKLSLEKRKYVELITSKFYKKYLYWNAKMDSLKTINQTRSDYGKAILDSINSIMEKVPQFELQYIKKQNNIYGYYRLLEILKNQKYKKTYPIDTLEKYIVFFQKQYPNHPYSELSHLMFEGLKNIKIGSNFIDFNAKDALGKDYNLASIISKNKFTLIDLWSTWCAPCIQKSQLLLPIYEKYKNKGFDVVGVIGNTDTQETYLKALQKYNYPWLELTAYDNNDKIWMMYTISNSGGGQFLVDNKGKILAINPTPKDIMYFISKE